MTQPTIDSEVDILVGDIVALGTDHPNGAFPDGKKPDGTYAVQNEAEAAQTITNLIAQEANKAVVAELKLLKTKKVKGANLVELKWVDDRLGRLTVDKEQA